MTFMPTYDRGHVLLKRWILSIHHGRPSTRMLVVLVCAVYVLHAVRSTTRSLCRTFTPADSISGRRVSGATIRCPDP